MDILGQILGILAVGIGAASFQMKSPRGLLFLQILTASAFSLHYLCLEVYTAMALNLLAVVSCVVYYLRDKSGKNGIYAPLIFAVLKVVTSILTWDSWYSALIMVGLVVNSLSLAMKDAQKIRYSMFIKCPLCLAYNVLVGSLGGAIYESMAMASSLIGCIRYSKKTDKEENASHVCDAATE